MDDYVSKPIREPELRAALERAVRRGPRAATPEPPDPVNVEVLARLRATVGSDEALGEVTATFLEDTERTLEALRADVEAGAAAEVRRRAHSLKSTAASFGASRMADLSRTLEQMGFTGGLDGAGRVVADLADEFARVRERLRQRSGA
jgi:HPt (histidine-containing phosphotransfer) domain-containing protein